MATVLPPQKCPSALLQRRLTQAQHNQHHPQAMDMEGLMSSFNMAFRPDHASMQFMQSPHHAMPIDPSSMAPNYMYGGSSLPNTGINMDGVFANPWNLTAAFNAQNHGSLSWATAQQQQTPQLPTFRNDSYSSMGSETYIKTEEPSPVLPAQLYYDTSASISSPDTVTPSESSDESKPTVFSTDIDTLMRAIQSKSDSSEQSRSERPRPQAPVSTKCKKRYHCAIPDCGKAFYQKTHLEIHTRAHTGVKPFICKEPACGQRFSQLGNLKTHERRHTGERPYHCDICGKTFAQHGNVRAHKIVHTAAKPFTCKLDSCNKQFTQLGNLKSHQNKFHVETIRRLKQRFETFREGDVVDHWEKEMWEYFGSLYKNCNKGIKGRGKDRRISNTSATQLTFSTRRDSINSSTSLA